MIITTIYGNKMTGKHHDLVVHTQADHTMCSWLIVVEEDEQNP